MWELGGPPVDQGAASVRLTAIACLVWGVGMGPNARAMHGIRNP